MSRAYYNEFEPYAAKWLRNLIDAGQIMPGTVDDRSIKDVRAREITGHTRYHWFAGIAGWDYALQLAGWPADRPVWTASCPCQSISCAGKRRGAQDERHLWPELYRLISECRPECIFGEQTASGDGLQWLDGISLDLEELGYAVAASDLPAAGVGAPHIRQRLYWVADANERQRRQERAADGRGPGGQPERLGRDAEDHRLAHSEVHGRDQGRPESDGRDAGAGCDAVGMGNAASYNEQRDSMPRSHGKGQPLGGSSRPDRMGDPHLGQLAQHPEQPARSQQPAVAGAGGAGDRLGHSDSSGSGQVDAEQQGRDQGATPWSQYLLIPCRDNKLRRISAQPGDVPLAHGIPTKMSDPRMGHLLTRLEELGYDSITARGMLKEARSNRVGRLRGYGNAIVPQVAAAFIRAYMDSREPTKP